MNGIQLFKRGIADILKGAVAAIIAFIGLMLGGMVTKALNLPEVVMPAYMMDLSKLMPLLFLSEVVIAIVLGECFQRLYQSYWQRLLALWLCNYVLYYLLNTLDAFLFTTYANLGTNIVASLFPALFAAAVIALLWSPKPGSVAKGHSLQAYFSARKPRDWAWRLVAAWLVFPPIYYLAGRGAAAFTLSYYQDPSHSIGLALNFTAQSLLAMEVLRGALFLLAVLPIIAAWRGSRVGLWLQVGLVIFVQIAIQTIVQAYWMPFLEVRVPHGIEMLVDSFAQACAYAWLLLPAAIAAPAQSMRHSSGRDLGKEALANS